LAGHALPSFHFGQHGRLLRPILSDHGTSPRNCASE
jgi:hypothetical protein